MGNLCSYSRARLFKISTSVPGIELHAGRRTQRVVLVLCCTELGGHMEACSKEIEVTGLDARQWKGVSDGTAREGGTSTIHLTNPSAPGGGEYSKSNFPS